MGGYRYRSGRDPDRVQGLEARYTRASHADEPGDTTGEPAVEPHDITDDDVQDVTADAGVSRALSLAATLLDAAPWGVTKAEIRDRVELYRVEADAETSMAFEQLFNRDKRYLRSNGIEIIEHGDPQAVPRGEGQGGRHDHRYLIDPLSHGLPPIELTPPEVFVLQHAELLWSGTRAQAAIRQAAGALLDSHRVGPEVGELTGHAPMIAARRGLADDRVLDHVSALAESLGGSPVAFDYSPRGRHRRERRRVMPFGVGTRGGWYLVGHDLDREDVRVYRLDRMSGGIEQLDPSQEDPSVRQSLAEGTLDPVERTRDLLDALGPARGTERVQLEVTAPLAPAFVPHALPGSIDGDPAVDDVVRMAIESTLHDAFIAKIAVNLPGVRVLAGERLVTLTIDHLTAVVRAHTQLPPSPSRMGRVGTSRGPDPAENKIARVMNMAAFLHSAGGARLTELLQRYSIEARQLHRDLLSLQQSAAFDSAQFGHYIDVTPELPLTRRRFEEELLASDPIIRVSLPGERLSSTLGRPLSLSTPQALSLLIALEGLISSDDPAEAGLRDAGISLREKIRGVVPEALAATAGELSVAWMTADEFGREPQLWDALRDGYAVEILYEDGRGRRSRRTVDPVGLIHDGPRSYLRAWCRSAQGERNFLLTRMLELTPLPETPVTESARHVGQSTGVRPEVPRRADDMVATVHFAPSAAAVAEDYAPLRETWTDEGARTAEISLRGPEVAIDLALRYGGDITVLAPSEVAAEVLRRAQTGLEELEREVPSRVEYPGLQTKGRTS